MESKQEAGGTAKLGDATVPTSELTEWNKKQLAFLEKENAKEIMYGNWNVHYELKCRTCNVHARRGAAEMASRWLEYYHSGHSVWIDRVRG